MSDVRILETSDPASRDQALREAAAVIRAGGIVGHPTETVYGLAADPWNSGAIVRLNRIKGRAGKAGLILIVASLEEARSLAASPLPAAFADLSAAFWPGPVTLVVPPGDGAPPAAIGSGGGLAIRWTPDRVAQDLVRAVGHALTSTSANRSGDRPATSASEIVEAAGLLPVDLVLDDGPRLSGAASTLVDLTGSHPRLLREGAVPRSSLEKVVGPIRDAGR